MAWLLKPSDVVIVSGGLTTFSQFQVQQGRSRLHAMFTNSADKALDQFEVAYSVYSDTVWQVIANATSDFASATMQWPVLGAGDDLTTLPLSTSAALEIDIRGRDYIRFRASSAAGSDTTLTTSVRMQ